MRKFPLVAALLAISFLQTGRTDADETEARLAAGDPERGRIVFRKCVACHSAERIGKERIGPNLWGIVGARIAEREGYSYSKALTEVGGNWTLGRLDAYLTKPSSLVKGTSMKFAGLRRASDRANVIAYLSQMSDRPAEFVAAPTEPDGNATAASSDFGILVPVPGAEETAVACTVCHSERILAQQGLSREQWEEQFELMVDEHEMEPLQEAARAAILEYLTKYYGPDRPNFPVN